MSGRIRPPVASVVTCWSKIAVLEHPGHLDHPSKLQLSPLAAGLGRTERGDQVAGLLLQLVVRRRQVFICSVRVVYAVALDLEALHPLLVLAQLLAYRP